MSSNYLKAVLLIFCCVFSFSCISAQEKYVIQYAQNCSVIRNNMIFAPEQLKILFLSDSIIFNQNSILRIKKMDGSAPRYFGDDYRGTRCLNDLLTANVQDEWAHILLGRIGIAKKGVTSIAGTRKEINDSILLITSIFHKINAFINNTTKQRFSDFNDEHGINAKFDIKDSLLLIQNNLTKKLYVDVLYKAGNYTLSLLSTDSRFLTDLCIPAGSSLSLKIEIDAPKDNLLYIICSEFPMPLNGIMNEETPISNSFKSKFSIELQMLKVSY